MGEWGNTIIEVGEGQMGRGFPERRVGKEITFEIEIKQIYK